MNNAAYWGRKSFEKLISTPKNLLQKERNKKCQMSDKYTVMMINDNLAPDVVKTLASSSNS